MPCPHFSVSIVKRSDNSSAVSAAAYQSASKLYCEYDQDAKDYNYKQKELFHEEVMLPENAPPEYADREKLWNSVEAVETQWNSQLARKLNFSLPREVPPDQYVEMVRSFLQEQFVSKGMIADFAIHDPHPPGHNPHVHLLLTMRSLDEQGRWLPKSKKEYLLDENGERMRTEAGYWKSRKVYTNDWNNPGNCETWRDAWEKIQNHYLEMNGRPERVSLKSYERQGIDLIPTVHMGPAVAHMEAKGIRTNIGDLNRDIKSANSLMASIRKALASIREWIANLKEKRDLIIAEMEKLKEPTLSDLLLDYFNLRSDERDTWSSRARLNGTIADYQKVTSAASFLKAHELFTLDDLHAHVDSLEGRYKAATSQVKSCQKRMNDIIAIRSASQTLKELKPVHDAWLKKNFKRSRDRYHEEHSEELKRYRKAIALLKKVNGGIEVDHEELHFEYQDLQETMVARTAELDSVRDELKQLRTIQYYISRVVPEEAPPEKVSIQDRLSAGRMESDKAAAGAPNQTKKKLNIEH